MPPKRETVVVMAPVEVKPVVVNPLIVAAQVQRDKWLARLADTRSKVDECGEQLRRSKKTTADSEAAIVSFLQQATDLVYPKEIKEAPVLPVISAAAAGAKGGKGKNAPVVVAVVEVVAPPPPVLTEAQLKKKAKVQAALMTAYKKKKVVPLADEVEALSPGKNGSPSKSSNASPRSTITAAAPAPVAAPPTAAAAVDGGLDASTPRSSTDIRPVRPNDPLVKDELWEALMKLRETRIEHEDKLAALKLQIDMLRQRMESLVEMERVTRYASLGAENELAATVLRVEELQRVAKEQAKLEMSRPQSGISGQPVAAAQLGPIKNAPVATGQSPRVPSKK